MFYIHIVNFRCWKNKIITFPDNGLILLSGISGAGKSSILNAIYFALYGTGTKIITHGEKKCSVHLIFREFDIIRTKGPNRLVLTLDNQPKEYEDEVAQEIINKKFGTNFNITSYITQKMVSSFFNMGPLEKMNFLELLALKDENITEIKHKTKTLIKEKKELFNQAIGKLEVISKEFSEMKQPEEVKFPLEGKESDIKIKNESIYWKRTLKQIQEENIKLKDIETLFSKEKINISLKDKQSNVISNLEQKLKDLKLEKEKFTDSDQNDIDDMKEALDYLKQKRIFISTNEKYIQDKANFDTLLDQELLNLTNEKEKLINEKNKLPVISDEEIKVLKDKLSTLNKITNIKSEIEDKQRKIRDIEKNEKDKNDTENILDDLQKKKLDLEQRLDIKICPCCKSPLKINNNILVIAQGESVNESQAKLEIKKIQETISSYKIKFEQLKKEIILQREIQKKLQILEDELKNISEPLSGQDPLTNIETFEKKYEMYTNNKIKLQTLDINIKSLTQRINNKELSPTLINLQNQLILKKKEVEKIKKQLEVEIETDFSEDELQQEISKQLLINQKISSLSTRIIEVTKELETAKSEYEKIILSSRNFESEIKDIKKEIIDLEIKNKQHKKNNEEIQRYIEYKNKRDEYKKWKDKVVSYQEEENNSRKIVSLTETFLKKIQEAESIAISQTIDNINYYMNFYLEKFFTDNPITVQILPFKETKKDIKPSITIEVGYKDVITDINSLSGGEYDRVTLSVVLALNTLFGSDLLMLDESISSLDSDLTNEILDVLKDSLKDKIVIVVAHQIGQGIFDNVIDVTSI